MDNYNTRKIRQFLLDYFSDEELTEFCFDYFSEVQNAFGANWGKGQKIQQLLGYCKTHDQYAKLLLLLKEERSPKYDFVFGDTKAEIKFILPNIQLEDLSSEMVVDHIEGFRASLASVLAIPVELLEVVSIAPSNSIVVTVRLPLSDVLRVLQLTEDEKTQLGLQQVPEMSQESQNAFILVSLMAAEKERLETAKKRQKSGLPIAPQKKRVKPTRSQRTERTLEFWNKLTLEEREALLEMLRKQSVL